MLPDILETEKNADWIALWHAGDHDVLGQLHARYACELLAFFAARISTHQSAEDMSQSVWLKLWKNRQSFQHGDFRAWMYRVAHNLLIDHWRKKYPALLEEGFDPTQPIYDSEDDRLAALLECLDRSKAPLSKSFVAKLEAHRLRNWLLNSTLTQRPLRHESIDVNYYSGNAWSERRNDSHRIRTTRRN